MKKHRILTPEELEVKIDNEKAFKVLLKEAFIDLAKIWGVWGVGLFTAIIGIILSFALNWVFPWAMICLFIVFFVCAIMGFFSQRDWLKYKTEQKAADRAHALKINKKE